MASAFTAFLENFAGALLDAERPAPVTLSPHSSPSPQKRFAVYRNNVVVGLVEAMRAQFRATERIVGTEFFAAMARVYAVTEPPRSPILVNYGIGFPGFIERFEPAAEIPYLADVARLEGARTRAYHAADAAPLESSRWEQLDPDALANVRVVLHPSLQVLRSRYPVVTIWSMNAGKAEPASIEECGPEDALIVRPQFDVQVRQLPAGGAAFLNALAGGARLGDAAATAFTEEPAFDLTANLAGLIGASLTTELHLTPTEKDFAS